MSRKRTADDFGAQSPQRPTWKSDCSDTEPDEPEEPEGPAKRRRVEAPDKYSIGDVALIKGIMEGLNAGAETKKQRAANWNNPSKITDDQLKNFKVALQMGPGDKIRLQDPCELNDKYNVTFTTTKKAHPNSGGAVITVRYNPESDTARFTEVYRWG